MLKNKYIANGETKNEKNDENQAKNLSLRSTSDGYKGDEQSGIASDSQLSESYAQPDDSDLMSLISDAKIDSKIGHIEGQL